jgi:hypothetical protein
MPILDQAKFGGKQIIANRGGVAFGDNARDNITITGGISGGLRQGR